MSKIFLHNISLSTQVFQHVLISKTDTKSMHWKWQRKRCKDFWIGTPVKQSSHPKLVPRIGKKEKKKEILTFLSSKTQKHKYIYNSMPTLNWKDRIKIYKLKEIDIRRTNMSKRCLEDGDVQMFAVQIRACQA